MNLVAALTLAVVVAAAAAPQAEPPPVDLQHSKITVYVYKQGLFSFLADNHTIDAPIARGSYDARRMTVQLTVDVSKMRVMDPQLNPARRSTVQSNMLSAQVLDAAKYPNITFQSTSIAGTASGPWTVSGNLQLHGQTHPIAFQVKNDGTGHVTGFAIVRQTAYGITPIKIAGGAVSVKDDVRVEFDVPTQP